jgi:hypothetical protein
VNVGRFIDTCASLERREAALEHSALMRVRSSQDAREAQIRWAFTSRAALGTIDAWSSSDCAAAHLRYSRACAQIERLREHEGEASDIARKHGSQRRHWAALRRGVERRTARAASQVASCRD